MKVEIVKVVLMVLVIMAVMGVVGAGSDPRLTIEQVDQDVDREGNAVYLLAVSFYHEARHQDSVYGDEVRLVVENDTGVLVDVVDVVELAPPFVSDVNGQMFSHLVTAGVDDGTVVATLYDGGVVVDEVTWPPSGSDVQSSGDFNTRLREMAWRLYFE